MKRKKVLALAVAPVDLPQPLLERHISLMLEQGGYINLKFSKDNISGCVAGIIYAVEGAWVSFDPEVPITVTFQYWQLDQELRGLTITTDVSDFMNGGETIVGCVRRMVAQAKRQFTEALSRQEITLIGPLGQLGAA